MSAQKWKEKVGGSQTAVGWGIPGGRNSTVKGRSGRQNIVAGGEREAGGGAVIGNTRMSLEADGKVPPEALQEDRMSDKERIHQGRRGLARWGQRPRARKFVG